ncbi:beta strand repeat-containing protein, partial [Cysteiniphilum sp. SYW-8]
FKVNDGDVDSAVLTATVNVTAVNSAPVNTIPATQVIKENNTLVFNTTNANVISIADDNSNSTVTLSVTNGILTLSQVTGLTFNSGSNGTASMQITGTLTDINAALNGMSYQPTTSFTGADTLTVLSDDGTLSSSDPLTINVLANIDPKLTTFEGPVTLNQLGANINGAAAFDNLGHAVSVNNDGSVIAVASKAHASSQGVVQIYQYNGSAWVQLGSDILGEFAGDNSGSAISLSDDGMIVAIGAENSDDGGTDSGHVRVFQYNGSNWVQLGLDIAGEAASDRSGSAVSLSGDGQTLAIGASLNDSNGNNNGGQVEIYRYSGGTWSQLGLDIEGLAAGDILGKSVSLSQDGNTLAIGASSPAVGNGYVQVYNYNGSSWVLVGSAITGQALDDNFGYSVSLTDDGSKVAIGARLNDNANGSNSGQVRVYGYNGSSWVQLGGNIDGEAAGDQSGWSVSISGKGEILAISSRHNNGLTGHVRIYRYIDNVWQFVTEIDGAAADDQFGYSVALSGDGRTLSAGAVNSDTVNGTDSGRVSTYRLDFSGRVLNFTENDSATVIDSTLAINDGDDTQIQSAVVTINSNYANGEDVLSFTPVGNITGSFNVGTGVLSLSGADTLANYELALRSVKYQNTSEAPSVLARGITFTVFDGNDNSNVINAVVNVTSVPDVPVLTGGVTIAYTENDAAKVIDNTLAISDIDDTHLERATITISNNFTMAEDILGFTDTATIKGSYNIISGVLTLVGHDTLANYQAALRSVTYQNTSDTPNTAARTISFVVNDGDVDSVSVDSTINLSAVADAPVFVNKDITVSELNTFIASDAAVADLFGSSVAMSGNVVAIGAEFEDSGALNTNGAVYVYRFDGSNWVETKLLASDATSNAQFGARVALDGDMLFVSAKRDNGNRGAVYIFKYDGSNWVETQKIVPVDIAASDEFGISLAQSGNTLVVGSSGDDDNGSSSGSAYVYRYDGQTWTLEQKLNASDGAANNRFGSSVAISDNAIAISASVGLTKTGLVYVYRFNDTTDMWDEEQKISVGDVTQTSNINYNIAMDKDVIVLGSGDASIAASAGAGAVYIYRFNGVSWAQEVMLTAQTLVANGNFGFSVAIEGETVIASHRNNPTEALVYRYLEGSWLLLESFKGSDTLDNDGFGGSYGTIVIDNGRVLVGNSAKDVSGLSSAGKAYLFDLPANSNLGTLAAITVTEGDPAYNIATLTNAFVVIDVDTANFNGGNLTLVNTSNSEDHFSIENQGTGTDQIGVSGTDVSFEGNIIGSIVSNGSAGNNLVVNFTSVNATDAAVRALVKAIQYTNSSITPAAQRTITITVNDGDGATSSALTQEINVTGVSIAPVVVAGGTLNYTENDAASVIDGAITVSDADDTNLESATISITGNFATGQDVLGFVDTANITGSFNAGTGVLTLTGTDTLANYQAALRSVTYQNTSDNPSTLARTVRFVFNEGGSNSGAVTSTINITAVNDAPVVVAGGTLGDNENACVSALDVALSVTDA